ncbi:MAG: hypothetical protein ACPGMR_11520 [Pontibacterium sp.]
MAEHLGFLPCLECGRQMDVMSDKRQKLYGVCRHMDAGKDTGCGVFKYQTRSGQARFVKRYERDGVPVGTQGFEKTPETDVLVPPEVPKPKPTEKPETVPTEKPVKKQSFFKNLFGTNAPWEAGQ